MSTETRQGIVTRGHGRLFAVFADGVYYDCQVRGKVNFVTDKTTPVAVGDDVTIRIASDSSGVIEQVHERRSVLSRPAVGKETIEHVLAANIDSLAIIISTAEPDLKPGLIDRFIIAAEIGNLNPIIVINKIDLKHDPEIQEIARIYRSLGFALFLTSAIEQDDGAEDGIEELRAHLRDKRTIFAGHSGVGKSTLLNRLLPGINLKTSTISHYSGKGKHTTSHIELFHLPGGGFVIDTPGIKVLGLWQVDRNSLTAYYPEMHPYLDQCRFTGCSHSHEPDCAVKAAVADGAISRLRYNNYRQIYDSLAGG